jgi:hypothetical protein
MHNRWHRLWPTDARCPALQAHTVLAALGTLAVLVGSVLAAGAFALQTAPRGRE